MSPIPFIALLGRAPAVFCDGAEAGPCRPMQAGRWFKRLSERYDDWRGVYTLQPVMLAMIHDFADVLIDHLLPICDANGMSNARPAIAAWRAAPPGLGPSLHGAGPTQLSRAVFRSLDAAAGCRRAEHPAWAMTRLAGALRAAEAGGVDLSPIHVRINALRSALDDMGAP